MPGRRYYYRRIASLTAPIPLIGEERQYYEWLIFGILEGARRVSGDPTKRPLFELLLDEASQLVTEVLDRAEVFGWPLDGDERDVDGRTDGSRGDGQATSGSWAAAVAGI